jgi:Ni/Co efflux regulator RcnB
MLKSPQKQRVYILLCVDRYRGVFTMRSLAISGVALAALMVSQPALAEIDSGVGAPPMSAMPAPPAPMGNADDRRPAPMGSADDRAPAPASHMAHAPNRRLDYQRPGYGFQLPRQWMTPEYAVDYREHGLDRPARGFGWSRYYDDMVLTDQWGRVYDVADGYDRGGRGHGSGYRGRDTDGIVGGVAGAAVGAVAGNVIAGAGSRLAGSLIGGGVGALAGLAIELAISKKKHRGPRYDDRAHDGGRWDGGHGGSRWGGSHSGGHWGGGYPQQQAWSWGGGCNCGGGETVTTTTVTHHGGGGGYMVPRQVVTYENVYAPVRTKYRVREAAPTKYRVREAAPVAEGKTRVRLHTKTY